ncbi:hypothetical protein [Pseudomonas juntendi]|uniref:hypothetical protein n=1 Tax=Pseudomonas juntendi TaxID=2666183 RepID=UPI00137A6554|nr:hypothetical protein [Pseudomonas juntendi]
MKRARARHSQAYKGEAVALAEQAGGDGHRKKGCRALSEPGYVSRVGRRPQWLLRLVLLQGINVALVKS